MLVQEYKAKWKVDFQKIKEVLLQALSGIPIRIEHVGSTSVPGLAAKPIIDIDLIYESNEAFASIKSQLEQLHYFHNGDQGIPQREVFKRNKNLLLHEVLDQISHHLYACPVSSEELNRHLLFRDYLRQHAWARTAYQTLKSDLAKEVHQDRKAYAELKEVRAKSFISDIIAKARSSSNPFN